MRIGTSVTGGGALHRLNCKSVICLDDEHRVLVQTNTEVRLDNAISLAGLCVPPVSQVFPALEVESRGERKGKEVEMWFPAISMGKYLKSGMSVTSERHFILPDITTFHLCKILCNFNWGFLVILRLYF